MKQWILNSFPDFMQLLPLQTYGAVPIDHVMKTIAKGYDLI